jgi:hypothetical protein
MFGSAAAMTFGLLGLVLVGKHETHLLAKHTLQMIGATIAVFSVGSLYEGDGMLDSEGGSTSGSGKSSGNGEGSRDSGRDRFRERRRVQGATLMGALGGVLASERIRRQDLTGEAMRVVIVG